MTSEAVSDRNAVPGPRNLTASELEQAMQTTFPFENGENEPEEFSDTSFDEIANLLRQAGREEWSLRPRTYAVLRMINIVQLLDEFVKAEFWDIELPYSYSTLPHGLSASQRHKFLDKQDLVLTKAAKIEGGKSSSHASFGKDADNYLESLNELGRGGYGSVDRVRSKLSRKIYVRKRMNRSTVFEQDRKALKLFKNEIENLKRLTHRHLIRYVGSYTDPKFVGILMEPVADCDMDAFLNRSDFSPADFVCIRQAFGCLCSAILYLQEKQCRHKDIKPHNILLKGAKVYITDFGIARDWTQKGRSTTTGAAGAFSPEYAAPEVVEQQPRNSSSDIWSLGCVFLDMVTILKGETLNSKLLYFESNGTSGTNPRTNQEAYKQWIKSLTSIRDNYPVEWINNMIRLSPKARLTPQLLMSQITECDDDNQYYGICCDGHEEEVLPAELMDSEIEDDSNSEDDSANEIVGKKSLDPVMLEKRLCKAARTGDITSAKRWLRKLTLTSPCKDGESSKTFETRALYHAARTGNDNIIDLLIRFGCDLDVKWDGQTALIVAASHSHEEIVELLARNKASLDVREDRTLGTVLHFICNRGLHGALQSLLDCGADVNARDKDQATPLHLATGKGDSTGVKILLENGADVSVMDREGYGPLQGAAALGFTTIMHQLLDHGAKIDTQSGPIHNTALHRAVGFNQPAMVELLLQRGADINQQQRGRQCGSALHIAVDAGNIKVVEILLKWKPNLELRDAKNLTPLHLAIHPRRRKSLPLLLKANADVNAKLNEWNTPLIWAIFSKDLELSQILIDHGANMEEVGRNGETVLHHIVNWDDEEIMQFMLNNKANIEALDAKGMTPLMVAAEHACITSLRLLLANGAKTTPKDRIHGRTALDYAQEEESTTAVLLLLGYGAGSSSVPTPTNPKIDLDWDIEDEVELD